MAVKYARDMAGKLFPIEDDAVTTRPNFEKMLNAISRAQILWDQGDTVQARALLRNTIEHTDVERVFAWRPRTTTDGRITWLRPLLRFQVRAWGSSITRVEYLRVYPRGWEPPKDPASSSST